MSGKVVICCVVRLRPQTEIGDLTFAAYSCNHLNTKLLAAGDPLDEVQVEVENGLAFARNMRFGFAIDVIAGAARADPDTPWLDAEVRLLRRWAV